MSEGLLVLLVIFLHIVNETVRAGEHLTRLLRASVRRTASWRRAGDPAAPDGTTPV